MQASIWVLCSCCYRCFSLVGFGASRARSLAVPIASTLKIIFESIEPLRPLAVLMGSRVHEQRPKSPAPS